jgi:hypothetical protein
LAVSLEPVALPEVTWTYRRVYVYGRAIIFSALLAYLITKIADEGTLRTIALCLLGLKLVDAVLYMCGATATDITRLVKAVRPGRRTASEARP